MKSYNSYESSGVEWIGEIPSEWKVKRLKYITKSPLMYGANESPDSFDETQPRYIRITDIDNNGKLREDSAVSLEIEKSRPYMLKKDDILLARSGATVGKSYIFNEDISACFAGYMIKFEADKAKVNPKFVYYNTFSKMYLNWIESNTIQATIQNVSAEKYKNFSIALPDLTTQNAIVEFLDCETTRIDKLVKIKEVLIERLKEKRTALITHAVTRGLNKNVKMKPSGLDWIEELPNEWNVKKIKYIVSTKVTDGPHTTPDLIPDGIPFVSAEAVKNNRINLDLIRGYISEEDHEEFCKKCKPQKDDIFMVKSGATTGNIAIVDFDTEFSVWSPLALIRANQNKYVQKYVFYSMLSDFFVKQVANSWSFGTQQNIGMGVIENLIIFAPSKEEQKQIVDFLDFEIPRIDAIIKKSVTSIERLKEYRTALISNCVTGKIDVRSV